MITANCRHLNQNQSVFAVLLNKLFKSKIVYMWSSIKGLHMHVPLRYTKAKSLHLTCLKTPPPAGA